MAKSEAGKVPGKVPTRNNTPNNGKAVSIGVLQACLVDMMDLTNSTKQAHWNVKGSHFYGLHLMFEKFYTMLNEQSDELAERCVQLGGMPDGTTETIGATKRITQYDNKVLDGLDHCQALADRYAEMAKSLRDGIDTTDDAGDADTSDLLTQVSREVDKSLWMIEAHLQGRD